MAVVFIGYTAHTEIFGNDFQGMCVYNVFKMDSTVPFKAPSKETSDCSLQELPRGSVRRITGPRQERTVKCKMEEDTRDIHHVVHDGR